MACSWAEVSSVTRDLGTPKPALLTNMSTGCSATGQPLGDGQHLLAYAQVGADRLDRDSVPLLELGRRLGQPVGVAGDQDQVVTAGRQLPRELRPDA